MQTNCGTFELMGQNSLQNLETANNDMDIKADSGSQESTGNHKRKNQVRQAGAGQTITAEGNEL